MDESFLNENDLFKVKVSNINNKTTQPLLSLEINFKAK